MPLSKFRKPLIITIISIIAIVVLIVLFISPITKYLIEKYDKKYTGREITLDWAYVNPFTGYIHFSDLKIYESNSDTVFFSTEGLSVNFNVIKLFSKTYEISEILLDNPRGKIIQNKKEWNFDDLINRFKPSGTETGPPVHFSILNFKIRNGEFYFQNEIPVNYFIKKVDAECRGYEWDTDTISGNISFLAGKAGSDVQGNFRLNHKTLAYQYGIIARKFDLEIIDQYLKDLAAYGTFRGTIDANIKGSGNFNDEKDITVKGLMTVNNLHFGKKPSIDYASFDKLVVSMNEVSPKLYRYFFDSLWLSHPYFKYERYDHLDNLQTMFGKNGSNIKAVKNDPEKFNLVIEIARYIKVLSENFFRSVYKINKLAVINGDLKFNDYSLNEKFSMSVGSLYIRADSIDKHRERVQLLLKSRLEPYGNAVINLSMDPKDSSSFDLNCRLQKISAASFNPYLIKYTSFPVDRGTIEFNGNWQVRKGVIRSENHLLIIDVRLSDRVKEKDLKKVPMPLIFAFVRERGNVIDYKIPITGDLKNPKFHIGDVLLDLVENIFIKPPTTPYGIQVTTTENKIEKSLTLKWPMHSSLLKFNQEKFVRRIADFLEDNPIAFLSVTPVNYTEKEKEQILFFEAKKKYFLLKNKSSILSTDDSLALDKMSVKDSGFVRFMDKYIKDTLMFTVQQRCSAFVNSNIVNAKFDQLIKQREDIFRSYFAKNGTVNRLEINHGKNEVPYNGFSYYEINYKGDIPKSILDAYESLNEMNEEIPRNRYFNFRKRHPSVPQLFKK